MKEIFISILLHVLAKVFYVKGNSVDGQAQQDNSHTLPALWPPFLPHPEEGMQRVRLPAGEAEAQRVEMEAD